MRRLIIIISVITLGAALSACEGDECHEPTAIKKIEERNSERLEKLMDAADAYDLQRTKVQELTAALKPDRIRLTRMREAARDEVLGELLKTKPDAKAIHKSIDDAKRAMMPLNYKVLDQIMVAHKAFTTEQRLKMTKKTREKPDPFELSFIQRTGINLVLYKIDATDSQKQTIWDEINATALEVNKLITTQHKIAVTIATEWAKKDADSGVLKKNVDVSANGLTAFLKRLVDKTVAITNILTPKQREYTNDRIRRGLTCK